MSKNLLAPTVAGSWNWSAPAALVPARPRESEAIYLTTVLTPEPARLASDSFTQEVHVLSELVIDDLGEIVKLSEEQTREIQFATDSIQ